VALMIHNETRRYWSVRKFVPNAVCGC
jgi:hypothetical protein